MTEEKVTRTYKAEIDGFNYRVNKEIKDEKVISMNMDIHGENG